MHVIEREAGMQILPFLQLIILLACSSKDTKAPRVGRPQGTRCILLRRIAKSSDMARKDNKTKSLKKRRSGTDSTAKYTPPQNRRRLERMRTSDRTSITISCCGDISVMPWALFRWWKLLNKVPRFTPCPTARHCLLLTPTVVTAYRVRVA